MSSRPMIMRVCTLSLLIVISMIFLAPAESQAVPDIRLSVGDTTGNPGQTNSVITVYLTNTRHEISAFEVWLQLSNPEILEFQTDLDTVVDTTYWECTGFIGDSCTDSISALETDPWWKRHVDTVIADVGNIDTVGSLIGGWQLAITRSFSGGSDVKLIAAADDPEIPGTAPNIPIQGGGVLFRLLGDVKNIPDTATNRTVNIIPQPFLDNFSFSQPDGTSIGIITETVPDTNCFECISWVPPDSIVCLGWQKVNCDICSPECDSINVKMIDHGVLDTSAVYLITGALTVNQPPPFICGDLDDNGIIDITDLSILIDNQFLTLTPLMEPQERGDVDCSGGTIDITDLSVLIDNQFLSLAPLCCW
ncbi:MAG: hypothetical protein GY867_03290 [bacterium]|nr:hypothetical protein [bacterium]